MFASTMVRSVLFWIGIVALAISLPPESILLLLFLLLLSVAALLHLSPFGWFGC